MSRRVGDDYLLVSKDGDGWRIEKHRDNDDFWRAVTLLGIILMLIIAW